MPETKVMGSPNTVCFRPAMTDVRWRDGFWGKRVEQCLQVRIPDMELAMHDKMNGAYLPNFAIASEQIPGKQHGAYWGDGDCYKFIETLSYAFTLTQDPKIDKKIDEYIAQMAAAQEEDGYLHTWVSLAAWNVRKMRWQQRIYHEDYNFGHLFTAAAVHYTATGKENFLNVARRAADLLYKEFSGGCKRRPHWGWNPSHIMGLVDLYRVTEDRRYLDLAEDFVEMRGSALPVITDPDTGDQNQCRTPLREESKAVGHAVTGPYLYCGAADVAAEKNRPDYIEALKRIWHSITQRRMYVTGGAGAQHRGVSDHGDIVHEAFGIDWMLPNATAYNETCANISVAMFAQRMLELTGDCEYADVMERVLYNVMLASTSLDGTKYFYTNTLTRYFNQEDLHNDSVERWRTFPCYCCPPSVARTLLKVQQWAISRSEDSLWIHLYDNCAIDTDVPEFGRVALDVKTEFPWKGKVEITVKSSGAFALNLRIPGWATESKINVNGHSIDGVRSGSYLALKRDWREGDRIEMELPMPVRLIRSNPRVDENRGKVAVMRGPIVYCLETPDLPKGVSPLDVALARKAPMDLAQVDGELGGYMSIKTIGVHMASIPDDEALYGEYRADAEQQIPLMLVPYYVWNNRGTTEMTVWLPLA